MRVGEGREGRGWERKGGEGREERVMGACTYWDFRKSARMFHILRHLWSYCVCMAFVHPAKVDGQNEMPLGTNTDVDPSNTVLNRGGGAGGGLGG